MFTVMFPMAEEMYPDWSTERIHQFVFEEQRLGRIFDKEHILKENEKTRVYVEKEIGIYSLTTETNNYLMWSHYADSHRGICIGFNSKILYNSVEGTLSPVQYQEELPVHDMLGNVIDFHKRLLCTKSLCWEYENEYRLTKFHGARKIFKIPLKGIEEIILGCGLSFNEKCELINSIKRNIPTCKIFDVSLSKTKLGVSLMQIY